MTDYPLGRYRLAQRAYMPRAPGGMCEVLDADVEVSFDGAPGGHMIPLDDAATRAMAQAQEDHRLGSLDPVASLDLTMSPDTRSEILLERVQQLMAENAALRSDSARLNGALAPPRRVMTGAPIGLPAAPPPAPIGLPAAPPPAPPAPPLPPR